MRHDDKDLNEREMGVIFVTYDELIVEHGCALSV
jgi:hypothetical protein